MAIDFPRGITVLSEHFREMIARKSPRILKNNQQWHAVEVQMQYSRKDPANDDDRRCNNSLSEGLSVELL